MAMVLEKVVPFGRSLEEYRAMFALSDEELDKRILGVADGTAGFNSQMHAMGKTVVSVDPLYRFSAEQIQQQFEAVVDDVIAQIEQSPEDWVWAYHQSPQHLREHREQVIAGFVSDFPAGLAEGRYQVAELPQLPFADNEFELILCSHFLFLYSEQFDYAFHRDAVFDMLRVAPQLRVFPLLTLGLEVSPHLMPLYQELTAEGYSVAVDTVGYELQKGANKMLKIERR